MTEQEDLFEDGLEHYPWGQIIIANLVMILLFSLGALACWYFYPIFGVVYLIAACILVYVLLRKLVCVNCYYYDKWCGIGWGKLSALMFKKGRTEEFPTSIGLKLAPAVYGLLIIVPSVLLSVSIIQNFSWYKIILLILLLCVSFYSVGVGRKKLCSKCKMNTICPGSAVKKKKT